MKDQEIAMGRLGDEYKGGIYQNVTICVTEDCNLRCKYCLWFTRIILTS